jgi:putative transposase
MQFEVGHLFHIYNQGNNRDTIFFERKNYLFFLSKMEEFVLPYADIIAYCLMPNHFHIMVHVKTISQQIESVSINKQRSFNDSIGIILRSYTRAINLQENRTGSLFRKTSKAICLTKQNGINSGWYTEMGSTKMNTINSLEQYPQTCFNYIHLNPLQSGLVKKLKDWEFSSYNCYSERQSNSLINIAVNKEFIDFTSGFHCK